MKYQFKNDEEMRNFLADNVYTTSEAVDYLGISNAALSSLFQRGKLRAIKGMKAGRIFLLSDLELRKKEAESLREKYRPYEQ